MRIIAGNLGRRNIQTLSGMETRPTSDKNRGAIFNALGQFFDGGEVLDLFSGSGAMALEAISRGFDHATCVDNSKDAISVITKNVNTMKVDEQVTIVQDGAFPFLKKTIKQFDLIILDPPYAMHSLEKVVKKIIELDRLKTGGKITLEYQTNPETHAAIAALPVEVIYEKISKTATLQIIKLIEE